MIIATTSAASLSAGQALGSLQGAERDNALFFMVILIGVLQVLFGLLRFGRLTRFVSFSVMTGFIIGIAVLTILSQLPTVTGYEPTAGNNRVTQTFNLLLNLDKINLCDDCRVARDPGACAGAAAHEARQLRQAGGDRRPVRACAALSVWTACRSSGTSAKFPAAYRRPIFRRFPPFLST